MELFINWGELQFIQCRDLVSGIFLSEIDLIFRNKRFISKEIL